MACFDCGPWSLNFTQGPPNGCFRTFAASRARPARDRSEPIAELNAVDPWIDVDGPDAVPVELQLAVDIDVVHRQAQAETIIQAIVEPGLGRESPRRVGAELAGSGRGFAQGIQILGPENRMVDAGPDERLQAAARAAERVIVRCQRGRQMLDAGDLPGAA